jgi:isocitrate dehydrogenase (NAD+)
LGLKIKIDRISITYLIAHFVIYFTNSFKKLLESFFLVMASVVSSFRPFMGSFSKVLQGGLTSRKSPSLASFIMQARNTSIQAPVSKPEGRTKCTLIPGDGVGPEMMQAMQEVLSAAGAPVDFETFFLSDIQYSLSAKIEDVLKSVLNNNICLKGVLASPVSGDQASLNYQLRSKLDLFANVVHIKSMPGVPSRHKNLDLVVIREQTEGEFSSLEHETVPGVIECYKIVTAEKSRRIAKFAFDYATKHGRKKVTAIHKANIMKLGDGLFLRCCEDIAKLYPRIEFESMIIDNCTMQIVSNPHQFDVLVMGNLYGAIVDNVASGMVGGAGIVAGASYSADTVVFEPGARHTYAEAVGKNLANPTAILLCAAEMLNHVNLQYHGRMIFNAVEKVLKGGKVRTKDVGGQSSTREFTIAVINALQH